MTGCASHYVITMTNGEQIDAKGRPRLERGFYVYKDALGHDQQVSSGRVTEIAPSSMVKKRKDIFKPETQ